MTPDRRTDRPPGLLAGSMVTLVVFLALSATGIVLRIEGHDVGEVLIVAGIIVGAGFHWWSRRRWAEHRATQH
jgi:hypothetical protein